MLILTGGVFLLLALLSGIALLASPFGIANNASNLNWISFPLFSLIGPSLFMFSSETARAAKVCGVSGAILVVLGLGGLVAAFLAANGMLRPQEPGTMALWYVSGVGLTLGSGALGLKNLLDRRLDQAEPPTTSTS